MRAPSRSGAAVVGVADCFRRRRHRRRLHALHRARLRHGLLRHDDPPRDLSPRGNEARRWAAAVRRIFGRRRDRLCAVPGEIAGGLGGAELDSAAFALAGPGLSAFAADLSRHAVQPRGADRLRRAAACAGDVAVDVQARPAAIRFADFCFPVCSSPWRSPSASSARSCCRASACG